MVEPTEKKGLQFLDFPVNRSNYHFERAESILRYGSNTTLELERVVKEIARASALKPNDVSHYIALAECYRRALDSSSAIFALRYVLRLDPTNQRAKNQLCDLLIQRAQELMTAGHDFRRAIHYFDEALAIDSSRHRVWTLRAVCFIYLKDFRRALETINRLTNVVSNVDIDIYIMRAKVLWAIGLTDAGNRDMRMAMTISRSHPEVQAFITRSFASAEVLYKSSLVHQKAGDYASAIKDIQKALIINGDDVKLHITLSKYHRASGDLDNAYKCLVDAEAQFQKSDPYKSFATLQKVPVEIVHQTNLVLNDMSLKLALEGSYEKAIALINKAIASERRINNNNDMAVDYRFYMNRGDCYRALGQARFALADYHAAHERNTLNWDIATKLSMTHYMMAVDYFNDAEFAEAQNELSGAIQFNPKVFEYYALRGKACYYQGLYHEAYEDFKRALALNPNNEDIQMRVAQFERDEAAKEPELPSPKPEAAKKAKKKTNPKKVVVNVSTEENAQTIEVSYCASLLPSINPHMTASLAAAVSAKSKQQAYTTVANTKTAMNRGELWKVINDARCSITKSKTSPRVKKSKPPSSAVALKRLSQEMSRKALKNPLIAGVVTHKNDPMILAQETKQRKQPKKNSVSSRTLPEPRTQSAKGFVDEMMSMRVDIAGQQLASR